MIKIYGIKNCDTMKKAFQFFDGANIAYEFHDYKKHGVNNDVLTRALDQHGWENIINRKGMTWRKLPENERETMNRENAKLLAHAKPSVVKRPIIENEGVIILGFDIDKYREVFINKEI